MILGKEALSLKRYKILQTVVLLTLIVSLAAGCGMAGEGSGQEQPGYVGEIIMEEVNIEEETVALSDAAAALPDTVTNAIKDAVASGTLVKQNQKAVIDYSNTKDGYVMVKYTAETTKRLKTQVKGPAATYTYNVTPGEWTTLPLSDGNGSYQISIYENVSGTKYAGVLSNTMQVTMTDEFAPFIRPNQYVNYTSSSKAVAKAAELTRDVTKPLDKVAKVYDFVIGHLTYDTEKAQNVKSGYLPVLDDVLEQKKGICFDYAALMTGMLRSQDVPCKLVVGYAGSAYHAWISVWTEENGWIDGAIFFNGKTWQRMDPTFASSANSSEAILKYIGDGSNYTAKYFY